MKPRTMRGILRKVSTAEQLDALREDFTPEWAGEHRGRLRVLAMLGRKRARLS